MWFAISCWCRDIAWSSCFFFFFSSRRRHTRLQGDWSSDVCSSDLLGATGTPYRLNADLRYRPPTAFGLFYFGGGFAYFHASGGGDAGANAFAGGEGRRAVPFKPFLGAELVFRGNTSFKVLGGGTLPPQKSQ